jgi:hypothetical protein
VSTIFGSIVEIDLESVCSGIANQFEREPAALTRDCQIRLGPQVRLDARVEKPDGT